MLWLPDSKSLPVKISVMFFLVLYSFSFLSFRAVMLKYIHSGFWGVSSSKIHLSALKHVTMKLEQNKLAGEISDLFT